MRYNEVADKWARFLAGLMAIAGSLLLAFAVFGLHSAFFGSFTPLGWKDLSLESLNLEMQTGVKKFATERTLTIVAIALLLISAIITIVADAFALANAHEDQSK